MKFTRSIAFELTLFICLFGALIFTGTFSYNLKESHKNALKNRRIYLESQAEGLTNRIEGAMASVSNVIKSEALFLAELDPSDQVIEGMLRAVIVANDFIDGSTISLSSENQNGGNTIRYEGVPSVTEPGSIKVNRDEGWYRSDRIDFTDPSYDEIMAKWVKENNEAPQELHIGSNPDDGNPYCYLRSNVPIKSLTGDIRTGFVRAEVSLPRLDSLVNSTKVFANGYAMLVDSSGLVLSHPDSSYTMKKHLTELTLLPHASLWKETTARILAGESDFVHFTESQGIDGPYVLFLPVGFHNWSLVMIVSEEDLFYDVNALAARMYKIRLLGVLLLSIGIALITYILTHPLRLLTNAADRVAAGELDLRLPERGSSTEVKGLTSSFNRMISSVKNQMKLVEVETATRARMESELAIAHQIQMSIVPRTFPPFPGRSEIDLYAVIKPAREVGGDFYDFFWIDSDHLCLTIGDVSGKGVPAALYMAITRTLLKVKTTSKLSPSEVISRINEDLQIDGHDSIFVSVFLSILNVKTGGLAYCSAGHEMPFIIRTDGSVEHSEKGEGLVAGIMSDFAYVTNFIQLQKNDSLILYTDGLSEALDSQDRQFQQGAMQETFNTCTGKTAEQIVTCLMGSVETHSADTEQGDDITLLVAKWNG